MYLYCCSHQRQHKQQPPIMPTEGDSSTHQVAEVVKVEGQRSILRRHLSAAEKFVPCALSNQQQYTADNRDKATDNKCRYSVSITPRKWRDCPRPPTQPQINVAEQHAKQSERILVPDDVA